MFDLTDEENIINLINAKRQDNLVIPLYVSVYGNPYSILEIKDINNCTPSAFKVGFGASNKTMFSNERFPVERLVEFQNVKIFNRFNEEQQVNTNYFMFESSGIDEVKESQIGIEINGYISMLLEYVMTNVEKKRKERIQKEMNSINDEINNELF